MERTTERPHNSVSTEKEKGFESFQAKDMQSIGNKKPGNVGSDSAALDLCTRGESATKAWAD
jgi:hypothetical protein